MTEVGVRGDLLIGGWLGVALVVLTVLMYVAGRRSWDGAGQVFALVPGICAVIFVFVFLFALFPFRSEYLHIYRAAGTVVSVTNTMDGGSGELTSTPVLELDTVDRPITMSDPRALTLAGKDVTLTCTIGWHYQAADTYDCEIYAIGGVE